MKTFNKTQSGFTLIEMIVALGLFSVVITISVGALLSLIASNEQLQKEQSVMVNLSFALDSMTREIRTGTKYFCDSQNSLSGGPKKTFKPNEPLDSNVFNDCHEGNKTSQKFHGISFVESGQSITGAPDKRIVYYFDKDAKTIMRRVSGGTAQSIVSSGIAIEEAEFFVTGSRPLNDTGGGSLPKMIKLRLLSISKREK